jgi:hypothetical protein
MRGEERGERNPCRDPIRFYAGDNTPLRSSRRHRDAGFPIIYPNLGIRLKKVHGFYTVFSLFRIENCGLFCIFPTVFFPPHKERTPLCTPGSTGICNRLTVSCNRLTVFCNRKPGVFSP